MQIVRIWIYRVLEEALKFPEAKPSSTNIIVTKKVRGDFKYYAIDEGRVTESSRKQAETIGQNVETWRGYPAWMHDLGYRA